jgi:hypothetical protein
MGFAQSNALWQGYFSYNEIKDLSESPTTIFAASENALFSKNNISNQIKTTTTIDGLSGQTIASLYYSPKSNKTLVGYEDGLLIVINEADGSMVKIVDIISKQLPAGLKKINHFMEFNGIVYISCDFGIVQFNLAKMQFGDTFFIGDNGTETIVKQTTVFNGFIYAATNNGIKKANLEEANLIDFSKWQTIIPGNWSSITAFDQQLISVNISGEIYKYDSNSFALISSLSEASVDMRTTTNYLVITTATKVLLYDNQMVLKQQISRNQISIASSSFTCATIIGDLIYIGTKETGLISCSILDTSNFGNSTPFGPLRNSVFALQATSSSLWAVYGGYSSSYNPDRNIFGISKYNNSSGWSHIPSDSILGAESLSRIIVNPNKENEVYVSSFFSGLLKIIDDTPTFLYNQINSELESLKYFEKGIYVPSYISVRINGIAFDKSGNLWMNNSLIKNGLKELKKDGQWQSYSLDEILVKSTDASMGRLIIDDNGTKWWCTNTEGLIGFNETTNKFKKISLGSDKGNLPSKDVRAVAVDTRGALWIGTKLGLRVLSNVSNYLTDDKLNSNAIIILENNLAQELMYEQFITDIIVDGANNKWIGTLESGVFLVSPDGQQTIHHFTAANSPLPSNAINDIDINSITGEVFIATTKGLVSFKANATGANEDLNNVFVYPNPMRPEFDGTVKIAGLLDKANIKITDIQGNLVYETTSEGGTIEWDTTAFGKYKVASGVYMIFVAAKDGIETKVKKLMIIR